MVAKYWLEPLFWICDPPDPCSGSCDSISQETIQLLETCPYITNLFDLRSRYWNIRIPRQTIQFLARTLFYAHATLLYQSCLLFSKLCFNNPGSQAAFHDEWTTNLCLLFRPEWKEVRLAGGGPSAFRGWKETSQRPGIRVSSSHSRLEVDPLLTTGRSSGFCNPPLQSVREYLIVSACGRSILSLLRGRFISDLICSIHFES